MSAQYQISFTKLFDELSLEEIYMPIPKKEGFVRCIDVNRPGLGLAGFFEVFDADRIQIFGKSELAFLNTLDEQTARQNLLTLCSHKPPLIILTRGLALPDMILEAAKAHQIPIARTDEITSNFIGGIISVLAVGLAPRITRHGVLMEIYGDGVLILGESGVGKSETAVELIVRGHRLIADDAVEIRKVSAKSLVGSAPENIRHFMELRGIGVVNIRRMFGMSAVKVTEKIDLLVKLEPWNDDTFYDRLGSDNCYTDIMGIKVPTVTIPVKPGRNLAVIIEAATMNLRLKKMGYHPARELMRSLGMPEDELPPAEKIIGNANWDTQ